MKRQLKVKGEKLKVQNLESITSTFFATFNPSTSSEQALQLSTFNLEGLL
jgi:hypothetical protein